MVSPNSNGYWRRGTTSILSSKGGWQGKQKELHGSRVSGIWAVLPPCSQGLFSHKKTHFTLFHKRELKALSPANLCFSSLSLSFCKDVAELAVPWSLPSSATLFKVIMGTKFCWCPKYFKVLTAPSMTFGVWEQCPCVEGGTSIFSQGFLPTLFLTDHLCSSSVSWWECNTCRPGTVSRCLPFLWGRRSGCIPSFHCALQSLSASLSGKSALWYTGLSSPCYAALVLFPS